MKNKIVNYLTFTVLFLFIFSVYNVSFAQARAESKVTFYVSWYDVGQAALEGLKGVKRVEKGFRNSKESNTVYYDPSMITIKEMEQALKKAGTYIDTAR